MLDNGTSDEDKQQWVSEYKKSMEAQEQLPLLFQTMTAANFMNVKTLLDELCKFVAEMIAQRRDQLGQRLDGRLLLLLWHRLDC